VGAVPVGLWLLLNPSTLSIDYGIPLPNKPLQPLFLLGCAMYFTATVGIFWFLRRSRPVAIGLALWLAALLPTQSLSPKLDPLTNRPLSLALAGLLLVLAPLFAAAWTRLGLAVAGKRGELTSRDVPAGTRWVASACAVALVLGLSIATAQRARLFQSELSLWQDAASKSRTNAQTHMQYAVLLKSEGRDKEAWEAISIARSIDPFSSDIAAMSRTFQLKEVMQ
jgi:hypothetical protein